MVFMMIKMQSDLIMTFGSLVVRIINFLFLTNSEAKTVGTDTETEWLDNSFYYYGEHNNNCTHHSRRFAAT